MSHIISIKSKSAKGKLFKITFKGVAEEKTGNFRIPMINIKKKSKNFLHHEQKVQTLRYTESKEFFAK